MQSPNYVVTRIDTHKIMLLKVGELAKRTGLTIRTLHHYDAIGLLTPSARSEAGYRLYNNSDIARLHGIQGLRNLGLPLADIDRMLAAHGASFSEIIARQLQALDHEISRASDLRNRLLILQNRLSAGTQPDTEDLLAALDLMTTHGKYFTSAELKKIAAGWEQTATEWPPLLADIRTAMALQLAPDTRTVQILARRWMELSLRWINDDVDLLRRWKDMCLQEPVAHGQNGVDPALFQYIQKAIEPRALALQKYLSLDDIKRLDKHLIPLWDQLELETQAILQQNLAADSDAARQLAIQWHALVDQLTDHDPVLRKNFLTAMRNEPLLQLSSPLSPAVRDFIRRAYLIVYS